MSTEHAAVLNEIAARDLATFWSFLEDEHFEALFLDNGLALVVAGRLHCGRTTWQLEFAADVLEPACMEPNEGTQHDYSLQSGDAFWAQSRDALIVEAAAVVGPIRHGQCHAVDAQTVTALSHMRGLLLEQIDEALRTPDTIFRPEFAEWMDEELPSSEALLDHLVSLGQTMTSPTIQEFLTLLGASKRRRLH